MGIRNFIDFILAGFSISKVISNRMLKDPKFQQILKNEKISHKKYTDCV